MNNVAAERLAASNLHYFFFPVEYAFEHISGAGYRNLEFFGATPHFFADSRCNLDCGRIRRLAADNGLNICCYHPEAGRHMLCISDNAWRKRSVDLFKRSVSITAELGARIMAVDVTGAFRDEHRASVEKRLVESLSAVCERANETGITLALAVSALDEPGCVHTLSDVASIISSVNSSSLKALLRVSRAAATGETVEQWFEALGDNIVYVHFTDGRPGGAYVWGEGCLPMEKLLNRFGAAGYCGYLSQFLDNDTYQDKPFEADTANMRALSGRGG